MAWISRDRLDNMRKEIELLTIEYSRLHRENILLTNELRLVKSKLAFMEEMDDLHELWENDVEIALKEVENLRLENRR